MEQEALKQMFVAENLFEKDSFNMALNGDGNAPGFLEIIDKYSSTPSGNLANYYAESAICTWVTTKTPLNTWKNSLLTM